MCLDKVTKIGSRISDLPKFGYKIVGKRKDGTYETWDCPYHAGESHYPLNHWETDTSVGRIGNRGAQYPTGFHLYAKRSHAVDFIGEFGTGHITSIVAIKCKFSKVVAEGIDSRERVIIARKIMNVGEIKIK